MSLPKVVRTSANDNLFPSVRAKLHLSENFRAHLGYRSTLSQPALGNRGGVLEFNESTLVATVPHPDLLPGCSRNFSGRFADYFEPVGNLALTLFQNDISDSVTSQEFPASAFGFEDDPLCSTCRFVSAGNRPGSLRVRGGTIKYSQALSFLPGLLKGLNASAGSTRTYASARRAAMTPHMISGTLSYRDRGLTFGVAGKGTDATPFSTTGVIRYRKARAMINLNGGDQLTARTGLFFQVRNRFNIAEYRHQIDPRHLTPDTRVGTFSTFGLKGVL